MLISLCACTNLQLLEKLHPRQVAAFRKHRKLSRLGMITRSTATCVATSFITGAAAALFLQAALRRWLGSKYQPSYVEGVEGLVGGTKLILIPSLSQATGCQILAKVEMLNPGGSVKDRVALQIIKEAASSGRLREPGGLITEGTAGSTGVSLAMLARARGCRCHIAMPDDAAQEKAQLLEAYGAVVERVRPVSFSHPDHFVHKAERAAAAEQGAVFADQFENLANMRAHEGTADEIWQQTAGQLDAFVCGAGTGGTIAGVSKRLKQLKHSTKVVLVDPQGSGLYNKVTRGVMYAREEAENTRLRNPCDTITEGVGVNRVTANFEQARIDAAVNAADQEATEMAAYLLRNDGLFVGSSSAINCVGAVKTARWLGPGHTVVTILCDGGQRHLSRFHNPEYLEEVGLSPSHTGKDLDFVQATKLVPCHLGS